MITTKELKDVLKTKIDCPNWFSGSMKNAELEKIITVYHYKGITPKTNVISNTKRDNNGFSVLIHWNKNSEESELKAEEVYKQLEQISIQNKVIKQIEITSEHAIPLGTDDRGIFEFVINLFLLEEV